MSYTEAHSFLSILFTHTHLLRLKGTNRTEFIPHLIYSPQCRWQFSPQATLVPLSCLAVWRSTRKNDGWSAEMWNVRTFFFAFPPSLSVHLSRSWSGFTLRTNPETRKDKMKEVCYPNLTLHISILLSQNIKNVLPRLNITNIFYLNRGIFWTHIWVKIIVQSLTLSQLHIHSFIHHSFSILLTYLPTFTITHSLKK